MTTTEPAPLPVQERRTKRRLAHELYPGPDAYEVRPLAVEVPRLYARAIGLNTSETGWAVSKPEEMGRRIIDLVSAARAALLADALHQGMTGDEAWTWVSVRVNDDELAALWERAEAYGVTVDQIKPYPCGPTPDHHYHQGEPDARGWTTQTRVDGPEEECVHCTEPVPLPTLDLVALASEEAPA